MSETQTPLVGKKIKLLLVENDLNQNLLAKDLKIIDSVLSDKLNGKVKITTDELYNIIVFLNKNNIPVDANYFMTPTPPPEISDTY